MTACFYRYHWGVDDPRPVGRLQRLDDRFGREAPMLQQHIDQGPGARSVAETTPGSVPEALMSLAESPDARA